MNAFHLSKQIIPLAVVCSVLLGYQYLGATWTEPTATAPNNNTEAPLNVGSDEQVKNGGLGVDALAVFGDVAISGTTSAQQINASAYCDENGENCGGIGAGTVAYSAYTTAGAHSFIVPAGIIVLR